MNFSKQDTQKVKGIGIIIMLLYHLFGLRYNFINYNVQFLFLPPNFAIGISEIGNVCVSMFAFLSAFGIVRKIKDMQSNDEIAKNSLNQYRNLLKIFVPIFITSLLFFSRWISVGEVYGNGFGKYIYMFLDFLGLSNLFGGAIFNPTWWYMTLAILIIFLTPLLNFVYNKIGILLMPLIALLPLFFETNFMIAQYSFVIACGVCFSRENYLEKIKEFQIGKKKYWSKIVKFISTLIGVIIFAILKQSLTIPIKATYYAEQILAIIIIYFIYEFLIGVKIVSPVLNFLGKHSANIYFTHTFFIIWVTEIKDFLFHLKYAWIIFLATLVLCVLYSLFLELIKKIILFLIRAIYK